MFPALDRKMLYIKQILIFRKLFFLSTLIENGKLDLSGEISRGTVNPLFQEGGWRGGLLQPPQFRIFPRIIFAFLQRLPYGQFTHPLSRYPCIYEKFFQNIFAVKKVRGWGEGGVCNNPLVLRGKGRK